MTENIMAEKRENTTYDFYDNQAQLLCDSAPGIGTVITLKIPKIERMEK